MMQFVPIFVASFFLSIHYGSTLFFNSSFLNEHFQSDTVSLLFLFGALANIFFFLIAPKLIRRFGKRSVLFFFYYICRDQRFSVYPDYHQTTDYFRFYNLQWSPSYDLLLHRYFS